MMSKYYQIKRFHIIIIIALSNSSRRLNDASVTSWICFGFTWNSLPKTRLIVYLICFLNSLSETDSAIYSDSAESDEMDCADKPSMVGFLLNMLINVD